MRTILLLAIISLNAFAQDKIAILPFINADGDLTRQIVSYDLQDSLYKALLAEDPNGESYELITIDDIENTLAEFNIDPTNPEYESDMWKACKELGAKYVITGDYNFENGRYLIDCSIYLVKMKMPLPSPKAENIFKSENEVLAAIPEIVEALLPGLKKS